MICIATILRVFISPSDCERYMERTISIAEEWMYSGPLKFQFYPDIPHGITAAFSYVHIRKRVRSFRQESGATVLSFIDVLESLVGPNIRTYVGEP